MVRQTIKISGSFTEAGTSPKLIGVPEPLISKQTYRSTHPLLLLLLLLLLLWLNLAMLTQLLQSSMSPCNKIHLAGRPSKKQRKSFEIHDSDKIYLTVMEFPNELIIES